MSNRHLDKTYEPRHVEARWYQFWTERGYFHASVDYPGQPFCIVIPPPNITGSLHIGHALNNTLQDILVRWRRMQGRNVLWMPGTDHAGIATQNVVERQLLAEGTTRESLGREKFLERVWQWKSQSGDTIIRQLKRLGASCDWERTRFTMDEGLSRAVREVFVTLFEDGLIYRGERLINWCPRCLTALSDIEVEHEEVKGKLYSIDYPLSDDPALHLTVATTRPETMLGDTAVAVHPEDARYNRLIGKLVKLPLTSRTIPIVGDALLVDREFGTGAVKITPAHDFNDFEAGERHGLPKISILDRKARLDAFAMKRAEVVPSLLDQLRRKPVGDARRIVVEELRNQGLLVKTEDHKMAIGKCYRCKTVVEPYLSPQWFVKIQPLAEPAIRAVEDGRIRIIPDTWRNNYLGWMRNIKDWCISRQIWWGHRIPAWYCRKCLKEDQLTATIPDDHWRSPRDATPIVSRTSPDRCPECGEAGLTQDIDVLDTWFSSALWPFSTLGWPDKTNNLEKFYPTSTLVTGLDILFFWVARMIMMGLRFMGDVPFRDVYIHALVRDAEGQKMSKSKGNVIDPLHVMDDYGTDALRFTLASMASPGRDVKLAEERIQGYRNFANKLWNAARFILMHLEGECGTVLPHRRSFPNRWILSRLQSTIQSVNQELEQYRFDRAASILYQFIWHEYCDWYLEMVKPALQDTTGNQAGETRATLVETFEVIQRLLHPFMPFITEEIWQALPHESDSIMTRPYPTPVADWEDKDADHSFALLECTVALARTGRSLLNYPPGKSLALAVGGLNEHDRHVLGTLKPSIKHLARASVQFVSGDAWPHGELLKLAASGITVGVAVERETDLDKALDRVAKQLEDSTKEAARISTKLANPEFVSKAPPEVVEEHHTRLTLLRRDEAILTSSRQQLQEISTRRAHPHDAAS